MSTILDRITEKKRLEIERAKTFAPLEDLKRAAEQAPAARDFFAAVHRPGEVALIAEVKKASPSKGVIREEFRPVEIARTYEAHGAACISVLTDESFFQGHLEYLKWVKQAVGIPVLRKDFILDPYQVWEARAYGADAVLLIAECLDDESLSSLYGLIRELGMTALVELYDPANVERVVDCGARLIGINNRNLHTFEVDIEHTIHLRREIPADRAVVAESGIASYADVCRLQQAGVQAMLVGESLMREEDIGAAVDRLLGRTPEPHSADG
ncbi:indole-3-glycerol phosphate synthase TrpC [Thermostilla marina]